MSVYWVGFFHEVVLSISSYYLLILVFHGILPYAWTCINNSKDCMCWRKYQCTRCCQLGICINVVHNIMFPLTTIIFMLLTLYSFVCSYSTNLVLVTITFHIVHLFLSLALRMPLILLTMFAWLICLGHYIGWWIVLYLGYSANEAIGLIYV